MLPVPFLENLNGCLRCHKSLSPLKTRADTEQTSQGRQSVLPQVMLKNSEVPEVTVKLERQGLILRQSVNSEGLQRYPGGSPSAHR